MAATLPPPFEKCGLPSMIEGEQHCNRYCCTSYANYVDVYSHLDYTDELQNDIHPIFEGVPVPKGVDRKHIEPSLRLASLMITSQKAAEYIATIVDGTLYNHLNKPIDARGLTHFDEHGRMLHVNARCFPTVRRDRMQEVLRAHEILCAMVDLVSYRLMDKGHSGGAFASTTRVQGPLNESSFQQFRWGCQSLISIAPEHIECLRWRAEESFPRSRLLQQRFYLAIGLVHELGHAVNKVAFGQRDFEVFYKTVAINEAGHTIVGQIFGGMVNYRWLADRPLYAQQDNKTICRNAYFRQRDLPEDLPFLELQPWPAPAVLAQYRHSDYNINVATREKPKWTWMYRVRSEFVEKLFTMRFWTKKYATHGYRALRPKKLASYPFEFDHTGRDRPMMWERAVEFVGTRRAHAALLCPKCPPEGPEFCEHNPGSCWGPEDYLKTSGFKWLHTGLGR